MSKEPIITDLFRFITVRSPQLLTEDEKERGFVYFPIKKIGSSHFLSEFGGLEDDKAARKTFLENKAASFSNYFTKLSSIKELNPPLYVFSLWLMKNKNILLETEVVEKSKLKEPLTEAHRLILWDNLLYQTVTERSSAIRDAILQMLVADNFLRKNDIESGGDLIKDDEDLRRLAKAYVVIPKDVPNNAPTLTAVSQIPREKDFVRLKKQLDVYEAKIELEDHTKTLKEFDDAVRNLENENKKDFNVTYEEYLKGVQEAYKNATEIIDPETGDVTYENLDLPEFNFAPKNIFDKGYLEKKLSTKSLNIVQKAKKEGVDDEGELINYLEKLQTKNNRVILENKKRKTKTVFYKKKYYTG